MLRDNLKKIFVYLLSGSLPALAPLALRAALGVPRPLDAVPAAAVSLVLAAGFSTVIHRYGPFFCPQIVRPLDRSGSGRRARLREARDGRRRDVGREEK